MIKPIIQQPGYSATRGKTSSNKRQGEATAAPAPRRQKAHENHIPAPESLSTLIRNAIASLKSGHVLDRGSIINLSL